MQTSHCSYCDICLLGYYITNAHTIKFVSHQMNMHNCETWSVNSSTCSASTCMNLWMHICMLISLCYAIWSERKSEKVFEVHGRAWEQGYQNVLAGEGVVCLNPLNTPAYRPAPNSEAFHCSNWRVWFSLANTTLSCTCSPLLYVVAMQYIFLCVFTAQHCDNWTGRWQQLLVREIVTQHG